MSYFPYNYKEGDVGNGLEGGAAWGTLSLFSPAWPAQGKGATACEVGGTLKAQTMVGALAPHTYPPHICEPSSAQL